MKIVYDQKGRIVELIDANDAAIKEFFEYQKVVARNEMSVRLKTREVIQNAITNTIDNLAIIDGCN